MRFRSRLVARNSRQGKFDEADDLFARAMEIWEQAVGSEHPMVATLLNDRACLLFKKVRRTEGMRSHSPWVAFEKLGSHSVC